MNDVAFPKGTDGWSRHQAETFLKSVMDMFHAADIQALADLFTEDCLVRYGASGAQQGRVPLRRVLTAQFSRRPNLRVQKTCIAIDRNKLTIRSEESWTDDTGKTRSGFGVEVWTMVQGKIAVWEAAFSAGDEGEMRLAVAA
jgi:nuclear transport factor 2 (NTF2) superfamily protein